VAYQSEIEFRVKVIDAELKELEQRAQAIQDRFSGLQGSPRTRSAQRKREAVQAVREEFEAVKKAVNDEERLRIAKARNTLRIKQRLRAQEEADRLKGIRALAAAEQKIARQNAKLRENLALGAGFPLLFGGGVGAVGGGIAGAVAGSKLGDGGGFGLQILFSALGQQIDNFFAGVSEAATTVADSLGGTTETLEALGEAGIFVERSLTDQVQALEDAGRAVAAYDAVQKELTDTYGESGLQSLRTLKAANEDASRSTSELNAVLQAELAPTFTLISDVSGAAAVALAKLVPVLNALLNPFQGTPDPARAEAVSRQERIDAGVRERAVELETGQTVGQLSGDVSSLERQTEIARLNNDLTNDRVVLLKEIEIITKATSQVDALDREIFEDKNNEALKAVNLAKIKKIEAQQALDIARLEVDAQSAVTSAAEKAAREQDRAARAQERAARIAERAAEKAEKARMKELQDRIDIAARERQKDLDLEASFQKRITAIGNETALLQGQIDGNEELVRKQIEINALVESFGKEKRDQIELLINTKFELQEQVNVLTEQQQLYEQIGQTISSGIVNGIQSAIDGSKSLGESLSGILKSLAGIFLQAGIGSFGVGGNAGSGLLGLLKFSEGGYVSGPTPALVGEGGESEYIIPESKMRESMSRYSRGARGSAVIPEAGGSGASGSSGGAAVGAAIDVRYSVERINSVDYVTADQFQAGMQRAADEGAKQGEQKTLKRLQMSSGTRKRLGM
jgi:hypothetical protein